MSFPVDPSDALPSVPPGTDEQWMRLAIAEAHEAERHGDVPIGAVVVGHDGTVLGRGRNERERDEDPTAHAEILALRRAAAALGSWRVHDATLYVTLEPCSMCAGAIVLSRIPRVVFGCTDPKAGACGSVLDITAEPRLNHRPEVVGGVLADDCSALLRAFFAARRRPKPERAAMDARDPRGDAPRPRR
ncbi:tRNA adenosine(34) deaminase TadA [Patulibacter sp. NPDC049589]|uniref:tRNA adenosine(34) deaminase TadA n=1 Tax=Patulibacter sp. NPDC049589 TaxID=3154731 RepID=UPI003442C1BA